MPPAPQSASTPSPGLKRTHPTFHFFSGLVSGVSSAVLLQPADLLKTRVQHSVLPKLSPTANLLTGASARVFAGLIIMPITVIKVRYESNYYSYNSLFSAIRSIYGTEGIRGFFSGFGATAVRDAPYAGLYVVFYEACKARLSRLLPAEPQAQHADVTSGGRQSAAKKDTNALVNATSGVLAAATATVITNPFDAVKTRLQLMPQKYGNTVKAALLMLREDGIRGFFDGLGLRMTRKAVSSALAWTVYEELIGSGQRRFLRPDGRTGKEGEEQRL
ncbi:hypothetical protein DV737_g4731, partial [Chaetothyriales sp. CBS 132003]